MGMLEQQIEQDIKSAQLAGESLRLETLRGLKATLLNTKVATGKRETGLSDEEVLPLLAKQSKQRQESADMYVQGGDQTSADLKLRLEQLQHRGQHPPAVAHGSDFRSGFDASDHGEEDRGLRLLSGAALARR